MQTYQQSIASPRPSAPEATNGFLSLDKPLCKHYIDRRISIDTLMMESESNDSSLNDQTHHHHHHHVKPLQAFAFFCQSFAHNFDGDFIKKIEQKEIYLFQCSLGHKFMLSKRQVLAANWCNNCAKIHSNIQHFTNQNKGLLLSPSLSKIVVVQCEKKHTWEVSYKKATQKWCKECSRTSKRLLKEMISQENQRIENEKRVHQVI
jgi:hypothetical protein